MASAKKAQVTQQADGSGWGQLTAAAKKNDIWSKNEARLDFRLTRDQKDVIEDAASLLGQSVSDFAISALVEKAMKVTQRPSITILSKRDWEAFVNLLDSPPEPSAALKRAAKRYRKHHG